MSEQEKKYLVSALRFPEFRGAGEWEVKRLGDMINLIIDNRGKTPPTIRENGIPLIEVNAIGSKCIDYKKISKFVTIETYDSWFRKYLKKGDILFSTVGKTAMCSIYFGDVKAVVAQNIVGLRFNSENFEFMYYLLTEKRNNFKFKKIEMGAVQPSVKVSQMVNIDFLLPSLHEQQKIADCLSSLDALITLQTQKRDTLKAHKKGLMQQLFPAEGKTQPKLRFPEFRGEWVEKTLGGVTDYENGKAHEQDIDKQGNYIVVNSKFISTEGEVRKFSNAANLLASKDDILMVLSDVPNGRAIAKCFYVDKDNTYTVNQRICRLTSKDAVSVILFYLFNRNPYFLAFDDGVKQTNLKKDDVLKCPVFLPNDRKEQQKIADCLSSLDALITAQTKKIDALKSHKKGLMQQLFPAMDEVGA